MSSRSSATQTAGRSTWSPPVPPVPPVLPVQTIQSSIQSSSTPMFNLLQAAAEQMMIHRDFQAVFHSCTRGLQSVSILDQEDQRYSEFKAGFCILGIQALAEMNRWPGVLFWVLQHYEQQEKIPAKVLQLCILLYSKVSEPAVMQETVRVWLHCPANSSAAGFRTVAELYLLQVLVPLGRWEEARALLTGGVGSSAFTDHQRQTALDVIGEREQETREPDHPAGPEVPTEPGSPPGSLVRRLEALLVFLHRRVRILGSGWFPVRSVVLAAVLIYLLFVRLDPAAPSSFTWISELVQLIRHMWKSLITPFHLSSAS